MPGSVIVGGARTPDRQTVRRVEGPHAPWILVASPSPRHWTRPVYTGDQVDCVIMGHVITQRRGKPWMRAGPITNADIHLEWEGR